jgi:hypothetical protein
MENAAGVSDATARQAQLKLVVLGATGATGLETSGMRPNAAIR